MVQRHQRAQRMADQVDRPPGQRRHFPDHGDLFAERRRSGVRRRGAAIAAQIGHQEAAPAGQPVGDAAPLRSAGAGAVQQDERRPGALFAMVDVHGQEPPCRSVISTGAPDPVRGGAEKSLGSALRTRLRAGRKSPLRRRSGQAAPQPCGLLRSIGRAGDFWRRANGGLTAAIASSACARPSGSPPAWAGGYSRRAATSAHGRGRSSC